MSGSRKLLAKSAVIAGATAAMGFGLAAPAAADSAPSPSEPEKAAVPRGTCGQTFNPVTSGAKAHWRLSCYNGAIYVSGWVEDTDADGQCARVKARFANGNVRYSAPACPEGERESFSWSSPGAIADVYLYEYNV